MSYKILICNNASNEERLCEIDGEWGEASEYLWTEGNYGCDCNRHLFFERSKGLKPSIDDAKCGESQYSIRYAIDGDGIKHTVAGR